MCETEQTSTESLARKLCTCLNPEDVSESMQVIQEMCSHLADPISSTDPVMEAIKTHVKDQISCGGALGATKASCGETVVQNEKMDSNMFSINSEVFKCLKSKS